MADFIPVNVPLLDGKEKRYINECLETGWVSSEGPFVSLFEEEFSKRVGRKHGVAVANGTAALDIAVAALEIGKGDEVIIPSFTIISCASAVVRSGALPVLVDCDSDTWNMNISEIESRITPRTKAIMAVHIYGLPVDIDPLLKLSEKYGIAVIEDAAEAIGQEYDARPCGSFGTISTFSFYPNKLVTTGEGGMCLTDDPALAERCRGLRNLCFQKEARFVHEELGWNYRMTNLQAALGCAQLEQLDSHIAKKREMGRRYTSLLKDNPAIQLPAERTEHAENIYWVYGLVLEEEAPCDVSSLTKALAERAIGTRPFFWPMHEQPVFKKMGYFEGESYPVSERIARSGFYIPSGLALTENDQLRVAEELHESLS